MRCHSSLKEETRTAKFVLRFIVPGAVKEGYTRIFLVVGARPTTCTVLLSASVAMVAKKMGAPLRHLGATVNGTPTPIAVSLSSAGVTSCSVVCLHWRAYRGGGA